MGGRLCVLTGQTVTAAVFCPQAYRAAMQTQWSWVLQLCQCVEQHIKDNSAYFEVGGTGPMSPRSVAVPAEFQKTSPFLEKSAKMSLWDTGVYVL